MGNPAIIDYATRAADKSRKRVEVPEWTDDEGNVVHLYFRPFTGADSDRSLTIMREKYGPDESAWPKMERRVREIVDKAEAEDGSPAFRSGDVHTLIRKVPAFIINRIYIEMVRVAVSLEEAKGKSGPNDGMEAGSSEATTTGLGLPSGSESASAP